MVAIWAVQEAQDYFEGPYGHTLGVDAATGIADPRERSARCCVKVECRMVNVNFCKVSERYCNVAQNGACSAGRGKSSLEMYTILKSLKSSASPFNLVKLYLPFKSLNNITKIQIKYKKAIQMNKS